MPRIQGLVGETTTRSDGLRRQREDLLSHNLLSVNQQELHQKLDQIEEQARLTLAEFPKTLTKERQRMIIALVRYIRSESESLSAPDLDITLPADVTPLRRG